MKKFIKILSFILAFVMLLGSVSVAFASNDFMPELKKYGFIDCGEAKIEYGIYGNLDAEPLLLLPPNGGDMHAFDGNILPEMSKHFKVITISPRGTGKSDWVEGGMTFEAMSNDIVVVLEKLGIEKTNIFGFSDGGNLSIVFTLRNQERVKALAIMGSNINTWGTNTFDQIGIVFEYAFLCIKAEISNDNEIKRQRDIQGMMVGQPSLTFKDISAIKVPVLNIYGENDMIQRWHSKMITRSIEGAEELMIEGGGHSTCFKFTDTIINPALLDFYGVTV